MNTKKFILASLAVFITGMILDFIVHGLILKGAYESLTSVWRADMNSFMWIMYVGSLLFSFLFVYIFSKGYEGKGMMEGVRFGFIIGLIMVFTSSFGQYSMYPIPFSLAIQWFIYGMVEFIILGIVAAVIYKPVQK
jgi:hypothetical protein